MSRPWRHVASPEVSHLAAPARRARQLVADAGERAFLATTHPRAVAACWERLLTWPSLAPADITRPLLLCAGTADGRVTLPLRQRQAEIKAAGHDVVFFEGLDHRATFERSDLLLPAAVAVLAKA
jgi:hypothetical protein